MQDKENKDFLIQCGRSGVADFLYGKSSRPPRWMNYEERKVWDDGYNLARKACIK